MKFLVFPHFVSINMAILTDPFQLFPARPLALSTDQPAMLLVFVLPVAPCRALHGAGIPRVLVSITEEWKEAEAPFIFWVSCFGNIELRPRGSLKILFCRTAVFQRKREMRMRSCWPRQKFKATSVPSTVSDKYLLGRDISMWCTLSLPQSAKLPPLITYKSALCNEKSINASCHCDVISHGFPMSLPHWVLLLVHTQPVKVSRNCFFPDFLWCVSFWICPS